MTEETASKTTGCVFRDYNVKKAGSVSNGKSDRDEV